MLKASAARFGRIANPLTARTHFRRAYFYWAINLQFYVPCKMFPWQSFTFSLLISPRWLCAHPARGRLRVNKREPCLLCERILDGRTSILFGLSFIRSIEINRIGFGCVFGICIWVVYRHEYVKVAIVQWMTNWSLRLYNGWRDVIDVESYSDLNDDLILWRCEVSIRNSDFV